MQVYSDLIETIISEQLKTILIIIMERINRFKNALLKPQIFYIYIYVLALKHGQTQQNIHTTKCLKIYAMKSIKRALMKTY